MYQMTHAGGSLNFMGNEIGQFIEWRYYEGIEYFLAEQYETHAKHREFVKALNKFYNTHPALWQRSYVPEGFDWVEADDADQCVISFARHSDDPKDDLVILLNFEVNPYEEFRLGVPKPGVWEEVFNSDRVEYGGSGVTNDGVKFKSEDKPWNHQDQSIVLRVPPLGGTILKYVRPLPAKRTTKKVAAKAVKAGTAKATAAAKKTAAKVKASADAKKGSASGKGEAKATRAKKA
jgi:1,4-alpha-glucan branching enzyme